MRIQRSLLTLQLALAFIWACDSPTAPPAATSADQLQAGWTLPGPRVALLKSSSAAQGFGGNALGQIVGETTDGPLNKALFWSSVTADPVELPGRGGLTVVTALNLLGVAVGHDFATPDANLPAVAVRWVRGKRLPLGIPTGWVESYASDINNDGAVAGYALDARRNAVPYIWTHTTGFRLLGTLGGSGGGLALGISENGAVVGFSALGGATITNHAFVWDLAGGLRDLGTLPGGSESAAYDINRAGEVAGSSNETTPGESWAVKWQANGVPIRLPNPAGLDVANSRAVDIDERGDVVGTVRLVDATIRPVLWPATGGAIDLSTVMVGFVTGSASAILPGGKIVGTVGDGTRGYAAVWAGFLAQ